MSAAAMQHGRISDADIERAKEGIVGTISKYIDLKKAGKDHAALCPFHSDRTPSFTVSESKGFYHCHGCGAHGDAIDFVMEHEGVAFHEAIQSITGNMQASGSTPQKRELPKQEAIEEWKPVTPVPDSAGDPPDVFNRRNGDAWEKLTASRRWAYRDSSGNLLGFVCRFELPGGGKDVLPQSFCINTKAGEMRWRWLSFAKPRPLYGLDKLAKYPKAQVVIVEGEKAAEAGQALFEALDISRDKLVTVSWPGGGKAVKHVDWSPLAGRNVGLWPDADQKPYVDNHPNAGNLMPFIEQPGTVCMVEIANRLEGVANTIKFITPPAGVPDGWDLADPLPEGLNLLAYMKLAAKPMQEFRTRHGINLAPPASPEVPAMAAPQQRFVEDAPEADASAGQTQVTGENAIAFRPPSLIAADVRDGTECTRPLSETGNVLRLLDMHGERLRFVPEAKAWLVWRDGAWQWDIDGAAVRATAADLPNRIYNEGAAFDFMEAEHFAKWARKSQTAKVVDAAVRLLSDRGEVRLPLAVVDSDPMLSGLNNAREVIDLTTGKVRPAEPSDLVTKSLRVSGIGETAKASRWLQFLDQVFGGDDALIDWLHRWCGYLLSGSTREQIMLFCFGHGANGKSIFAETLRHVLGDYGRSVPVETLCESKRQAGGATPDLADLIGCRLAMSSETEDGQALAESLVKSLVAGDTISARPLYGRPVQFAPAFKLLMLGNHRPVIRGTDNGIWRRIRLVPFSRTFGPDERDPALLDKLKAEAPHILAWMLDGCLQWQRRGLADVPNVVAAQTKDYREEQDLVGQWLAERVDSGSAAAGCKCPSKLLYQDYCDWAEANGLRPCSAIALGRRLRERGFVSKREASGPEFQGIALKPKH